MAIALVVSTSKGDAGTQHTITSDAIDTTGADLLVVSVSWYNKSTPDELDVTDSKSNTWVHLTNYGSGSSSYTAIWYSVNPTVGTSHTFTFAETSTYPSIFVEAFSGADTTAPFDVENGAYSAAVTSVATGSVTPTVNGEVICASVCMDSSFTNLSIDSSFIDPPQEEQPYSADMGGALTHLIQGTAGAVNPTWSWTTTTDGAAAIATFKAAAGAAAPPFILFRKRDIGLIQR
jgi:hypothetical protein